MTRPSTNPLKILHVTFDMRIGGTEMVIKNLIEGIDTNHYEMSIFCIEEPLGPWGEALKKAGTKIDQYPRKPGFDFGLLRALRDTIKRNNIDVVHCHQYTPWVYGTLASILTSASVIFTEHGRFYPDTTSWKRRFVNPLLALATRRITAISAATRQALNDYEFLKADKITLVYNGIHSLSIDNDVVAIKQELGVPADAVALGTISRFDPIKNHCMMLEAFAKVVAAHPNTVLIMVGDGDERSNIEQKILQLKLDEKVILTGYQLNPAGYLAAMDIFLLSSLSEGTSMTLLEAMSLSKPCIVTDAGGNAEVIKDGYNGRVTENGNAELFASAIIETIGESMLRYGKNSRHRFLTKFTNEIMVRQYEQIYEGLDG